MLLLSVINTNLINHSHFIKNLKKNNSNNLVKNLYLFFPFSDNNHWRIIHKSIRLVSEKILVALFQPGQNNYVNQGHQTGGRVNRAVDQLLQAKEKDFAESMSERRLKQKKAALLIFIAGGRDFKLLL